jgi:hypothetical protein
MDFAENYALPSIGELQSSFRRTNDLKEVFYIRWGRIDFDVFWGVEANIKVILKLYRTDEICENFFVDTDPYGIEWNAHKRKTRDFYIHPSPSKQGRASCAKFSYILHLKGRSIASQYEYIFMDWNELAEDRPVRRRITAKWATSNNHQTYEMDAQLLQRDVDFYNSHIESLSLIPKFTKGLPDHPYHPKQYIHENIDKIIRRRQVDPAGSYTIKVCVDCIDDSDFINHLIYAWERKVKIQCIVDWRKMTLTNSENYARLKRSGIELLGVFCTPKDPLIEVAPDMHNKFIIFGEEDCIIGSFNITFDRWWANWESGMTFHSYGMCRLLDNIFQSVRGGVIQRYCIDPLSHFNVLYTFGRHAMPHGKYYLPHQAIISEIHRARRSIKACLFLIGELRGEYGDSVIDALIQARARGVEVQIILNGHLAREGDPGKEYSMREELNRPLLPAVIRLRNGGVPVALAYGLVDHRIPYCPLHSKYCIVDDYLVLDGCFNWYNTSTFSHDMLVVTRNAAVAHCYLLDFNQVLNGFRVQWI